MSRTKKLEIMKDHLTGEYILDVQGSHGQMEASLGGRWRKKIKGYLM